MITYFTRKPLSTLGAFNLGGTNSSGQVPEVINNWAIIDRTTPIEVYSKTASDGTELELVFSDEFNTPGRTFYPGDDPYWEAADLHYWATNNLEWYDPGQLTTENGYLKITLANQPSHGLNYTGGLMSSWNKFCFTGGRVEVAVQLPGNPKVMGLWPAIWAMGNLGRAGYGASLDGMWPYTYDSCDVGVLPNQTTADHRPIAATINGDKQYGEVLSYLPGQRLSACTCQGESHPGPLLPEGRLRGRSAPELDVLEAQVDGDKGIGEVSQSGQWAPFDASYIWNNSTDNLVIPDPDITFLNPYMGGVYQQATSGVTKTDQACYTMSPEGLAGNNCFSVYGFEYLPDRKNGYISWISNNQTAWTLNAAGMGPNNETKIGQRIIPEEPMVRMNFTACCTSIDSLWQYLIMNLGISKNFGFVDFDNLVFPVDMRIDWIRVYQPKGQTNVGCDPPDYPTQEYINAYIEAYTNPNLTTWVDDYKQTIPKNSILDTCPNGPTGPDLSGFI